METPDHRGFVDWMDAAMEFLVRDTFLRVGATEGSIWLVDEPDGDLVMAFNSGPRADEWTGKVRQPAGTGIIGMVLMTEQGVVENSVKSNKAHSQMVDNLLFQRTEAMIAVPLHFFDQTLGVLSCVLLERETGCEEAVFRMEHLQRMNHVASILGALLEHRAEAGRQ